MEKLLPIFVQRCYQFFGYTISHLFLTMENKNSEQETCPAQALLKLLAGKWKPEIFRLATTQPVRFNALLRQLPGSNKQSISIALKELEEADILQKQTISLKPLHITYTLTEKGQSLLPFFEQLELLGRKD